MQKTEIKMRLIPAELITPMLVASNLKVCALLESASYVAGTSRYSILMLEEAFRLEQHDQILQVKGKKKSIVAAQDILAAARDIANMFTPLGQDIPFPAGGIGYLSYEFATRCDAITLKKEKDPLDLAEAVFLFGHILLVFDHFIDQAYLIGLNYPDATIDLNKAMDHYEKKLKTITQYEEQKTYTYKHLPQAGEKEQFLNSVKKIREHIIQGDLLQGVLSRRECFQTNLPALEAYRRLRGINPSPYMFYMDFDGFQLFGTSPEVHLKVNKGKATIRPLAGTRPRIMPGKTKDQIITELQNDPKERAEHLMLVDLARNDLGRLCEPGSVIVTQEFGVEEFESVFHMVSQVEGKLPSEEPATSLLRFSFPAGTVSGAPKIRAMEIIDSLEPHPRGFYAGLAGYIAPGEELDTCITIRSAVKKEDRLYLQAGAGIVYDSDPYKEYEETQAKMASLLAIFKADKQNLSL